MSDHSHDSSLRHLASNAESVLSMTEVLLQRHRPILCEADEAQIRSAMERLRGAIVRGSKDDLRECLSEFDRISSWLSQKVEESRAKQRSGGP